ncbi:MAG: RNA polymerase sigma-70 factor [Tannerellaceae bacterium]|jgi:RNA polymerase sigma-70 factor (ECF subfamily)|nr:RNA polymerase sigma-70 factor [Tannerellaceae bacterium]
MDDLFVFSKIKEGDIGRFESVFRRYYAPLCLFAAGITGRRDVAEEIVQDLFYTLWKERESLQIFHSLSSYLYKGVRNRALQYCRHVEVTGRHSQAVLASAEEYSGQPDPQDILEYKELENIIERTLRRLPVRRLSIFRMHRFDGKKYSEIADNLSLSVKTVEAEITKALRTLRKEIENYTHTL